MKNSLLKSSVTIDNIENDGYILRVSNNISKKNINSIILEKILDLKKTKSIEFISIDLGEKYLESEELSQLKKYIELKSKVKIKHIYSNTSDLGNIISICKDSYFYQNWNDTNETLFINSNVRCGQVISYDGSIVILGNLNAGGVVNAGRFIIVLGSLSGIANAGLKSSNNAFIYATIFKPTRILIDNVSLLNSQIPKYCLEKSMFCYKTNEKIIIIPSINHQIVSQNKGCVYFGT